jgi:hypothetical protein
MRPAHLHFLASKDGFKTLISQIYVADDKFINSDVQFGVTRHLIGELRAARDDKAPAADVKGPWYSLDHNFVMEGGRLEAAARADQRQGAGREAEDPASGVRRGMKQLSGIPGFSRVHGPPSRGPASRLHPTLSISRSSHFAAPQRTGRP